MSISVRPSSPSASEPPGGAALDGPPGGAALSGPAAAGLMIALVFVAGGTPVATRFAMHDFPPFASGCVRFAVAGLLLMATYWLRSGAAGFRQPIARRDRGRFLLAAALCVPVNQAAFLGGVKLANASHAALFYALTPVLIYVITLLSGRARYGGRMMTATVLAFLGAAVLGWDGLRRGPELAWGDLLLFGAVLSWALYSVVSIPLSQRYGAMRALATVCLLGAVLYSPALAIDGAQLLAPHRASAVLGLAYITLVTSYLGYLLWFVGIARLDVNRFSVATNAAPLVAVVLAWLLLGELLSRYLLLGLALILTAVTLANWDRLRALLRRAAPPAGPVGGQG